MSAADKTFSIDSANKALDGNYELNVIPINRWSEELSNSVLDVKLILINPCKSAAVTLANNIFLKLPAYTLQYGSGEPKELLVWTDAEATSSVPDCGEFIWTIFDSKGAVLTHHYPFSV